MLFGSLSTLNPFIDFAGFILPSTADLVGRHVFFVYPSEQSITCYAEVGAHLFGGIPTLRDLIHFLHFLVLLIYTIIHFNYNT